jgi:HAD superfamily hydrolase (TIGR01484 family)
MAMHYVALAADFDGTLASDGVVDNETFAALERLRNSGRKLVLVTGRQLEDLLRLLPRVELFDRIVAENGAVVYCPSDRQVEVLGEAPPDSFVTELRARDVTPLSLGRVVVATWEPNETVVLETIRDFGLELQVIFNKGAVMVLPAGVNKATGPRQSVRPAAPLAAQCRRYR